MDELSLLVWLSRGNKNKLIELMCKYSGCDKEVYTDIQVIGLFGQALIDLSRKYHLKNLLYEYFSAKHTWEECAFFHPNKYTENDIEINALGSTLLSIRPKIFDEEDYNTIEKLKKEYLEETSE